MVPTHQLQIHRFAALSDGPRLIVTGAVHGNEVAGTRAIERVLGELMRGEITLVRGELTLVPVCNPLAHAHGRRHGERNLNRRLRPTAAPADNEDRIANLLCPLLAAHDVLLDLHSFSGPGQPFVLRGPADNRGPLEPFAHAAAEARLAAHVGPERIVDGWMDVYAAGIARRRACAEALAGRAEAAAEDVSYGIGTTEYMRSVGGYGVTLECGQHDDAAAPGVGWRAIRQTLALLGLAELALLPPAPRFECLSLVEVIDRHDERDTFVRPWHSFDPLAAGEPIARRADGSAVCATEAGFIVFPDASARPGREWFYLARPSGRPL
ncbi:MAG TPA: succinylglutamate desuccinylase/aspartoacylase family protein [Rubrivivax sp.]|nr:succinylglutamate desuccinylase/aspartoacylase family protein [Rubrivivax sp.]